ncbi:sugar ABC transporter permease [Blautia schinkii]|nr:sugar ABC transporter permease [Blautia schinkii]
MRNTKKIYSLWFMVPALLLYLIFFIIPNSAGIGLAFTDWNVHYFDDFRFVGLENFRKLFSERVFWTAFTNTIFFSVVTVIGKCILGFVMALLVTKGTKFNAYIRTITFLPVMISGIVVSIIFISIYNPDTGILNEFLRNIGLESLAKQWLVDSKYAMGAIAAMDIWQWTGFNMVIFLAGMQSIPSDYYEAAKIDGASKFQEIRYIMVPLLVQSFTVTFIFSIISGFKVFAQVYGTTNGGPADATQVMGTFLFKNFSDGYYGYSAAVGVVFLLMTTLVALIFLGILRKKEVEY